MAGRSTKGKKKRFGFGLILLGCAILALLMWNRLKPLIREMGAAEAENAVTLAINRVLSEMLLSGELDYADLVRLQTDESGTVTAVYANMGRINLLRAEIAGSVLREILKKDGLEMRLPLGNLLGSTLFSGRGPGLPLRILSVEHIDADLSSRFTSAGINQTLHQIRVELLVTVQVLVPGGLASSTVSAHIPVAETLLLGRVPDSYTYFEGSENWDEPLEQFDITT
ncbi:MAG: sporulation protein YunB [Oscillospiraceae bacterium]|nr:sporulation protein YunB [Oscillospiraceae bacterium]